VSVTEWCSRSRVTRGACIAAGGTVVQIIEDSASPSSSPLGEVLAQQSPSSEPRIGTIDQMLRATTLLVSFLLCGEKGIGTIDQTLAEKGTLLGIQKITEAGSSISELSEEAKAKLLNETLAEIRKYIPG
jgi:hypothetical protein